MDDLVMCCLENSLHLPMLDTSTAGKILKELKLGDASMQSMRCEKRKSDTPLQSSEVWAWDFTRDPRSRAAGYAGDLSQSDGSYHPAAEQRGMNVEGFRYVDSVVRLGILNPWHHLGGAFDRLFQWPPEQRGVDVKGSKYMSFVSKMFCSIYLLDSVEFVPGIFPIDWI